ncbi:elongation factor G [Balneolales bacterium ANBcel1]|nr:elongation factor G [Balneolales bacterium ANBcel1]
MNVYQPRKIRNIVLLGHSGSGKTTLAETMLFESGMTKRRGSVEESNTVSDYHPIEKEKQKSVYSSFMHLDWRGTKINVIDTPGTADYVGEVVNALKVADAAVFVLDAEHGVEVGTEVLWNIVAKMNKPAFLIVNKVDHANSDYQGVVDLCKERFGREVVPVQYPYEEGEGFSNIIDVLKMQMYEFSEEGGRPDKLPVPETQKSQAELQHNDLVETIAENDETLMDLYFEKGHLDEDEMVEGLKKAMLNRQIFPMFCLSAERNMGSGRVMGFIDNVIPNPLEANPDTDDKGEELTVDPDQKSMAFLFKTVSEEHVGDLTFFKAYGGTLKTGDDLINHTKGSSNRLGNLFLTQGGKRVDISEVHAGDIAAVVKLKDAGVGDTLRDKSLDIGVSKITYPEPTERMAVRSREKGEEEKIGSALNQIQREDPSLHVENSMELKQIILSGQGEEHLNVVKNILETRFKLHPEFYEPAIPYRETITKGVKTQYRHKKQSGGAGQYGEVFLYLEPYEEGMPPTPDVSVRDTQEIELEWGGKLIFQNCIVGGVIDARFMPAILKGVMDKMENGPLSGCRARDIRVSVFDGSMHTVDSNEAAFKTASLMAFRKGFLEAKPQLLEPIYEVEVTVPAEYMGDVMSDLSTRRGQVQGMDSEGTFQKVKAIVPLAELYRYATHLRSMTQGRATHMRTFHGYAPVPHDIQERVMKETAEMEEDS